MFDFSTFASIYIHPTPKTLLDLQLHYHNSHFKDKSFEHIQNKILPNQQVNPGIHQRQSVISPLVHCYHIERRNKASDIPWWIYSIKLVFIYLSGFVRKKENKITTKFDSSERLQISHLEFVHFT
eukprot:TRINITY_DN1842_c0_g1_i1.p1 TRINITY_DN1842_c0_g1~~TRINITY_DN1842_c0_g1_i1.p1  ORF type:complete len:125 (-),score=3.94 TRINITY_DN1842_c0_g1_i1:831-1205(-)